MGTSKGHMNGKNRIRMASVDPASRPLEWKARVYDAAAALRSSLEASRDHRESTDLLLRTMAGKLGTGNQAVYLDVTGSGSLKLLQSEGMEPGTLPPSIGAGTSLAHWLGRSGDAQLLEAFYESPGSLSESEIEARDSFADAGVDSACALKFGGDLIGIYLFSSIPNMGFGRQVQHEAAAILARLYSGSVSSQLISSDPARGDAAEERLREMEFRAVRNAVIEKTAADMETSLGVLKSGLWSIEPGREEGSVMIDMARNAAASLGSRLRELVSLAGIEPSAGYEEAPEVDVADIVEDVTRELIADFERMELKLQSDDRAEGRLLRFDPGRLAYIVRSMICHLLQSAERGGCVGISWAPAYESPEGEKGSWMALSISASVAGQEDDAIEAMLDSIASQQDADAGPPADSGLTLSKYMVESSGGLFLHEDDAPGSISAWIPLDW